MRKKTLGAYLDNAGNRPSGFDYMRLILASMIVCYHSYYTSVGFEANAWTWEAFPLSGIKSSALPMFFALSGFLVAGSMHRTRTLVKFLGLRFLRIYPALAIEVLLTALLLGPFVTSLPPAEYFTDPGFFRYLVNMTGHVTIYLPDVFMNNPQAEIANGQLWTVPYELYCYITLGGLILFGAKRHRWVLVLGAVSVFVMAIVYTGWRTGWLFTDSNGPVKGPMLVVSFLLGSVLYEFRYRIPASPGIAAVMFVVTIAVFSWAPYNRILGCFPAVYLTMLLGVLNPPRLKLVNGADYSYGIYLYHFVILQTVIHALGGTLAWYWTLAISFPIVVGFAAFSWHVVEKPILSQKSKLNRLEVWWTNFRSAVSD